MFCSNCGKEALGNFCSSCGASLTQTNNQLVNEIVEIASTTDATDTFINVNGIEVNISEIINCCGKNKIEAIKLLRDQTNVSLSEGKNIIDEAYKELYKPEPKKSFWQSVKEESQKQKVKEIEKKKYEKERLEQLERDGVAYCPKCHSTSLSAHKKGFGIGKAVVGVAFAPIGLVAGNIGAKKVRVTCLKCGNQFWAGKK
jgi:ribosomal protein L7/L12